MRKVLFSLVIQNVVIVATAWANGPLRSIIVFGNEKTERQTIVEMINLSPQTYINDRVVRDVEDRLMHSNLFKMVKVRKTTNPDGTADLRILVLEKQLWFVFPVFQSWSGRYSGGAVFGESNLFASGASTVFLLQGGNKISQAFMAVDAKNVFDSNFAVRAWLLGRTDDVTIYNDKTAIDEINMKDVGISIRPGYQWTNDIQTTVRFSYTRVHYGNLKTNAATVPGQGTSGNDVAIQFGFSYDTLRRREAFMKGTKLEANYEFADTRFGTDYTYHTEGVSWQQAFPLGNWFNYVYSVEGKIGDSTLPFHRDFTLGGSSLRGFADRQFRGDTLVVAKQDLLFRIYRNPKFSVFGLSFYDIGLLYEDSTVGINGNSLRNGVGVGLRVSLADILAPVFGLDAGYGIEDQQWRIYFALGLVQF